MGEFSKYLLRFLNMGNLKLYDYSFYENVPSVKLVKC